MLIFNLSDLKVGFIWHMSSFIVIIFQASTYLTHVELGISDSSIYVHKAPNTKTWIVLILNFKEMRV